MSLMSITAQVSLQQTNFTVDEGSTLEICAQLVSAIVPLTEDSEVQLCTVEGTATSPGMLCTLPN